MKQFFKGKIRYQKENDEGHLKMVTEEYIIEAVSFTDAEALFYEWGSQNVRGEFSIKRIDPQNITDLVSDNNAGPFWMAKIAYFVTDADSGKEKRVVNNMLFEGDTPEDVLAKIRDFLKNMLVSFNIISLVETKIIEVILPEKKEEESNPPSSEATAGEESESEEDSSEQ